MKKIICILLLSFLLANGSGMSDFADGIIQVKEGSGQYSTKERTLLYGGGYTMKVPNLTLTPFSLKAPDIKAGCGGIDMVFGSLGFLDKEQFVKFAEGIMAAAPGVAFDLALKTLCPSCADTLKSLQSMVNQINAMSLDSCSAATGLANALESAIPEDTKTDLKNNEVNNYFSGLNESYLKTGAQNIAKFNSWLNTFGSSQKPKIIVFLNQSTNRSLIEFSFKNENYLNELGMLAFLKSAIGDIYIEQLANGDNATIIHKHSSLTPLEEYYKSNNNKIVTNTERLINRLMGIGGDTEGFIYDINYNKQATSEGNFPTGILNEKFKSKVKIITNKIATRQALNDNEIAFLGYFKFPVYRIFNTLGSNQYTAQILDQSSEKLATMLSSQLIYELLIQASQILQERANELDVYQDQLKGMWIANKDVIKEHLSNMAKETRYSANLSYVVYLKAYNEFFNALQGNEMINRAKELKQLAINRANPQMLEQLMFLQTITPKTR